MLTSLNPLTCLDKLTVNSLDSIGERVRSALLHVFLPRLCEACRPAFSETFRVTQSTPVLLKCLCDSCKINYVRDKRAVSRKKGATSPTATTTTTTAASRSSTKLVTSEDFCNPLEISEMSTKNGAKKNNRSQATALESSGIAQIHLPKPKKVKLPTTNIESSEITVNLPFSPPPEHESKVVKTGKILPTLDRSRPIYEQLDENGIDWCRYCGAAGDTGTFWKLGPWGDRTLCHKHGCEFFGCGFARATSYRLDLTAFYRETRASRLRPVIQDFCCGCWERIETSIEEGYQQCHGCPLSFHASCLKTEGHVDDAGNWFCTPVCQSNFSAFLVKPQFAGKARFPFYFSIAQIDLEALRAGSDPLPISKISLRLVLPAIKKTTRKYRKHNSDETAGDRVVAFVPVKVDQSVHIHEDISTPTWILKTIEERASFELQVMSQESADDEELDDDLLLLRHSRYEQVEKTTRLLKPGVLEMLAKGEELTI